MSIADRQTHDRPGQARAFEAAVEWPLWGTTARIVITDPVALGRARRIADVILHDVESASSRLRDDSELGRIGGRAAEGVEVSDMLAALVERALLAARDSGGDVDPTLGGVLEALGYDRDVQLEPHAQHGDQASFSVAVARLREPGWTRVALEGRILTVPDDLRLDLAATAKAVAADLCATAIANELHCGVLVGLGGDISTAGPSRSAAGWTIAVRDLPRDPETRITLADGFALATSSTQRRRWVHEGRQMQHIVDPRLGLPSPPVWRSVTVAASSCYRANVLSLGAIVRGRRAVQWLADGEEPARLVDSRGNVVHLNGWPEEAAPAAAWRRAG